MESDSGSERRRLQRFALKALATVQAGSPGSEKVFELSTQDISSGGAFFPMEVPLPTGEKVKITLYLSISAIQDVPSKTKITTHGKVVRSSDQGIAVAFDRYYTMSPATT